MTMPKCIFIILLLCSSTASAQKEKSNFFAEVSAGAFLPLSKFSSKTYIPNFIVTNNNPSCLAKPGIGANLSFGYKLNKSVAIILMLGGSQNKQDAKAYGNYLKQQFGNAA
jgi:hypothetical protein